MCPKNPTSILFPIPCEKNSQCRASSGPGQVCCQGQCVKGVPAPRPTVKEQSHQRKCYIRNNYFTFYIYKLINVEKYRTVQKSVGTKMESGSLFNLMDLIFFTVYCDQTTVCICFCDQIIVELLKKLCVKTLSILMKLVN